MPATPASTAIADALQAELTKLGVASSYEASIALQIAKQLDDRVIQGAAYVSSSKELDRRVDALRLKAERADDPAKVVKGRLAAKRASLTVLDGGAT